MRRALPLWAIPVLVLMAVGTVWLRLAIIRTTYSINQADNEIRNLQQEFEQMEVKIAALHSPRRLELIARTKFALSQPKLGQVIHLDAKQQPTQRGAP